MALLKFNVTAGGVAAAAVQGAVLQLHVKAAGSGLNQFLVLGLQGAAGSRAWDLGLTTPSRRRS